MIEKMHEKTNSFAFKVIFSLVSLSFVLGGIGGTLLGADNSAVKINGEEISQKAFNDTKSRQQNILNAQLGERFQDLLETPEYLKQFNDSIFNELINNELLRQYAKELKLGISADQIKAEIVRSPHFQRDGKFDNALYQQLLRSNNLTPDQYAGMIGGGMLFSQLEEGIVNSDFALPVQQALLAKLLLQKRTVRLATYSVEKEIANQSVSDAELHTYFDAHKGEFITPEKLTVEYVAITPKDLEKNVQITPEQIETYYQTNKANYTSQGEAKIAHIQLVDEATANSVAQQLKAGSDFAALAKEKSADKFSATQGGELGWAKAGTYPKAFENAFQSLKAGEISPVVKVDNAYHIIKVLERKDEKVIPIEKVKAQITATLRNELALTDYANITREMANIAFENSGSLDSVAKIANATVQKTAEFSRENLPAELNNEKVINVLFKGDLRQTKQNEVVDVSNEHETKTLFLRVSDYKAEQNQTFEQAKNAVELALKREKAEKALLAKAEENVKNLQAGNEQAVSFEPAQTLVLAESQMVRPLLAERIFAMPKPAGKPQYQTAKNQAGDIVVIALDSVENGKTADFSPLASQFEQANQAILRNELLKDLRDRAKIEFNEDFIDQLNITDK